jgi:hypothetical protein
MTSLSRHPVTWSIVALLLFLVVLYTLFNVGGTMNGTGL